MLDKKNIFLFILIQSLRTASAFHNVVTVTDTALWPWVSISSSSAQPHSACLSVCRLVISSHDEEMIHQGWQHNELGWAAELIHSRSINT